MTSPLIELQQIGVETKIAGIIGWFEGLKLEITEWESFLKCQAVSAIEINQQFNSFFKKIHDLTNQAFLARVDISTCRAIANLKNIIARIKQSMLRWIDPQIDMAPSHSNQNLDSVFSQQTEFIYYIPPL